MFGKSQLLHFLLAGNMVSRGDYFNFSLDFEPDFDLDSETCPVSNLHASKQYRGLQVG
jgi:hypothetical protein